MARTPARTGICGLDYLEIFLSQVRLQQLDSRTRYETKRVVLCLIARNLAEWVVRGTLARLKEPPKHENGWVVHGTYKSFQSLSALAVDDSPLPSAELPGLHFEEPQRKRREKPLCALMA